MSVESAIRLLLTDYWDEIWAELDPVQRDDLSGAVRELAVALGDEKTLVWAFLKLDHIVRHALPEEHAVIRAAQEGSRPETVQSIDWPALADPLSERVAETVRQDVHDRLVGAPALLAAQVRAGGEDPDRPFLIRLDPETGDVRFPAFQFDPAGLAIGVVLEINQRLDSDDDPWGAADWWLGANARLDAVPADLIGLTDESLLAAADALTETEGW